MDNNNDREHNKKEHHEPINLAIQGMSENAQFSIAIAVGIFGILGIFVMINPHDKDTTQDPFWKNALWTKPQWIWITGIVLSIAYWALILFGIQSYIARRLFEGVMGKYLKKTNEEWYYDDIKEIAKENKLANLTFNIIWSSNYERKDRYKGMYAVLIPYLVIAFFLWLFIGIF